MTTRVPVRTNFYRALFLSLGLLFVQPSCFTAMVWTDSGPTRAVVVHTEEPPKLAVNRLPSRRGDAPAFVVELPGELAERMAHQVPSLSATARWLRVEPIEHADTVRVLLALAASEDVPSGSLDWFERRFQGEAPHPPFDWWLFPTDFVGLIASEPMLPGPETNGEIVWSIYRRTAPGSQAYEAIHQMPGFYRHPNPYTSFGFGVPCKVQVLPNAPDERGETIRGIQLVLVRQQRQDRHLMARILWTPVALAGDIILAPLELLWWLRP